jgi:hypothetical protein
MKIQPAHYEHMKAAIAAIPAYKIAAHKQFIANENKAKDPAKRLRWDLSHYAGLTPFICNNIYSYANDDHVDTALKAIMREVGAV